MSSNPSPFERRVFVCTSGDYCPRLDGESIQIHKMLKEQVAAAGLKGRIRVNNSGCLDQCGHGPMIVVHPESVWYSHVSPADVPAIVEQHLKGGVPVEDLHYQPPKPGANKLLRDAEKRRRAGQPDGCRAAWPTIPLDDPHGGKPDA